MAKHPYKQMYVGGRKLYEHTLAAERALGRPLPHGAEVHHVDGNRFNNEPSNLVICPDRAYHFLLHIRTRAMEACGNPNWRKCRYCQQHDAPENLKIRKRVHPDGRLTPNEEVYHSTCNAEYQREQKAALRLKRTVKS